MPNFQAACAHDHDCEEQDCSGSWSLNKFIDIQKVRCLNEAEAGLCKHVFKPWDQRLNTDGPFLRSDEDDPELLIHVPFTGAIKLQAIAVIGGPDGASPAKLKVFTNRDDLDFNTASEMAPVQEWDLVENLAGTMEYPTQVYKFNGVHSIDLYFPENFGDGATEIRFIAFKGEFTERRREAVDAVYETRPVPTDHKTPADQQGTGWNMVLNNIATPMKIEQLVLYPVKGCAGIELESAMCTPLGLATANGLLRDRTWVIVNADTGKFITQRQKPRLALVKITVDDPATTFYEENADASKAALIFSAPDMPDLRVPITYQGSPKVMEITVWDWQGDALIESEEAAAWFTSYLQTPATLVRHAVIASSTVNHLPGFRSKRSVNEMWADPSSYHIAFSDQFPYLVATHTSLAALNEKLPADTCAPMDRFRPNIILDGQNPWEEDQWRSISIGDQVFNAVKPCSRCKVPSIDQATGEPGDEPIRTMHTFRSGKALGWTQLPKEFNLAVFFGTNMCIVPGTEGTVRCGDTVEVMSLREGTPTTRTVAAV